MKRVTQLSFTGKGLKRPGDRFGGSLLKGNPKTARPVESKLPLHLVLRARASRMRTPANFGKVDRLVYTVAKKYNVRIYEFANVGNHLHLLLRVTDRRRWAGFIRELTGRIALACRSGDDEGFWLYRPFNRIIRSWKKAFRMARDYVYFNHLEAEGHIRRSEIKTLAQLRAVFSTA